MYIERSDDIIKEIYNFKVVHGSAGIAFLYENNFNHVPNISKDIHVVKITNYVHQNQKLNDLYIDSDRLNFTLIKLDNFRCFIDKVEPLLEFIKTINNKYVLYMDSSDTALMSDIDNPQSMLDTYNCKILFNAEDGYPEPDHVCKDKTFLEEYAKAYNCEPKEYYNPLRQEVINKNKQNFWKKLNSPYVRCLNAGLFLAEREYLIEALNEMLNIMNDDPKKGYPFGEIDDQSVWQYIQSKSNGEIEIDYLSLFFLHMHPNKFNYEPDHWEHFNYFNKLNKK